jgi:hypothetical protein
VRRLYPPPRTRNALRSRYLRVTELGIGNQVSHMRFTCSRRLLLANDITRSEIQSPSLRRRGPISLRFSKSTRR